MKEFFQGLVLGAVVMYGYVYNGAEIGNPVQKWFGDAEQNLKSPQRKKEADKIINGFFFPREMADHDTARV